VNAASESSGSKAEAAAANVRRNAETHARDGSTESERHQAEADVVDAHAELEGPKHATGKPRPGAS
jgi:hypothetical protein